MAEPLLIDTSLAVSSARVEAGLAGFSFQDVFKNICFDESYLDLWFASRRAHFFSNSRKASLLQHAHALPILSTPSTDTLAKNKIILKNNFLKILVEAEELGILKALKVISS